MELETRIAELEAAPPESELKESMAAFNAARDSLLEDEERCGLRRVNFEGAQAHLSSVIARRSLNLLSRSSLAHPYHPEGDIPQIWERMKQLQEKRATAYAKGCADVALGPYQQRASEHISETVAALEAAYRANVVPRYSWAPPSVEAAAERLPALRAKADAEYHARQAAENPTFSAEVQACTRAALRDMRNASQQLRGEVVRVCESGLRK